MKPSISKLVEVSKFLGTKTGKEIGEFIEYMAGLAEQTLRALNNGLSFRDNFDGEVVTVELTTGTAQVVGLKKLTKPTGAFVQRVVSSQYALDSFLWYLDSKGEFTVKATFTGSPSGKVEVSLVVLY